jgi:uncharacterized protein YjeT (DUF2065 family)
MAQCRRCRERYDSSGSQPWPGQSRCLSASPPGAAGGRRWHFFFAWLFVLNGLLYVIYALTSRRVNNVLAPTKDQLRHIGGSIHEHLRLRFPHGEAARDYNRPLTVRHGAPLRLRVERQLGYKMAKYVMRIEAIESFRDIAGGKGGYWEDRGYEWYAGI